MEDQGCMHQQGDHNQHQLLDALHAVRGARTRRLVLAALQQQRAADGGPGGQDLLARAMAAVNEGLQGKAWFSARSVSGHSQLLVRSQYKGHHNMPRASTGAYCMVV
jgi:hypothetical protein